MNSNLCRFALFVFVVLSATVEPVDAEPMVPSYDRFQNQNRIQSLHGARLLVEELNCVACHDATDQGFSPKTAPILTNVSGRTKAAHLRKFIADPLATKPGTTMPSLFSGISEVDRDKHVESLVHFLYSIGPGEPPQVYARYGAARRGKQLFHSVGCVGCHNPEGKSIKGSAPHANLAEKYTLASLSAFLQNPLETRPSGRMPSLNLTSIEASDIASYLLPDTPEKSGIEYEYYEVQLDRLPDFSELKPTNSGIATAFDVAKHGERGDNFALRYRGELVIDKPGQYRFTLASDDGSRLSIDDQVVVDNDGVHGMQRKRGRVQLDAGRHSVMVEFFEQGGGEELEVFYSGPGLQRERVDLAMVAAAPDTPLEDLTFVVDPALASEGKQLFSSWGCASCHEVGQDLKSKLPAPPLAKLDAAKGCLADAPTVGANYSLSDNQKSALRTLITEGLQKLAVQQLVQHTMMQFNCVACHERDKIGGVDVERTEYFTTTQQEMGMEGAIPPHLDGTGGKLTRVWLDRILANGGKDRPYMRTRMPKFGANNVGHLADQLERLDQLEPLPVIDIEFKEAKKAGHAMVGAKGFACIKCHTFGRHKATGVQSLDMTIMSTRLREDWFRTYLQNPQVYRRGTRMPSAWPETGPSLLPELLGADSKQQIAAVWRYLQDGVRAKTPFGLSTSSNELIPIEEAIIYRNFIQGAGSRAIGVGYPEGVHIAFDANELRLALIWQGAFMDASRHWNGRGEGYQPPAGEKVKSLAPGVSVARLESSAAAWPSQGARELGYKFRGYRLSADRRPTFMYEMDGLKVADFSNPVEANASVSLSRALTISGNAKPNTFLRLAVGSINQDGNGFDLGDGLQLRINGASASIREVAGVQELVIPLNDSNNERTIELEYIW